VTAIMTRLCRSDRNRNATRSSVERSAQCRSSTASSTGRTPLSRSSVPSTCSSSCALLMSSLARSVGAARDDATADVALASSGSSLDSAGAAGPSTSASKSGGMVRARVRSASTSGASGRPSPPSSTHCPVSTQQSRLAASDASSLVSRVFPMPASPPIRAKAGSFTLACSSCPASEASSSRRPMKTGLTTFAPTLTRSHNAAEQAPAAPDPRQRSGPRYANIGDTSRHVFPQRTARDNSKKRVAHQGRRGPRVPLSRP
jgi:hypothetical protein